MRSVLHELGRPPRYYDGWPDQKLPDGRQPRCRNEGLERVLGERDPDLAAKVQRAFKKWNLIIRDYLRSETGLRLSVGSDTSAVPVRVLGGVPLPLADVLTEIDPIVWKLLLHQSDLARAMQGLGVLYEHYDDIAASSPGQHVESSKDDIQRVTLDIGCLLEQLAKCDFRTRILSVDQDVLGAYYYRVPEVHLYWMVIGLVSGMLGVDVEALTVVVSAHELAHAYTHLGKDIDNGKWDTEAFGGAGNRIVEGLAQFYTAVVCAKLGDRIPGAFTAYQRLLEGQAKPYRGQANWLKPGLPAGEIVRATMVVTRARGLPQYVQFMREMARVHQGVTGRRRRRRRRVPSEA